MFITALDTTTWGEELFNVLLDSSFDDERPLIGLLLLYVLQKNKPKVLMEQMVVMFFYLDNFAHVEFRVILSIYLQL